MTYEEAETWIKRFEGGNSDDRYRPSSDLSILMRLMLHSQLKMTTITNLKVGDYKSGEYMIIGDVEGTYWFKVTPEDDKIVRKHIEKKHLNDSDHLITRTERALRAKFNNLVDVYHVSGERPNMSDFYYASVGIKNKSTRNKDKL